MRKLALLKIQNKILIKSIKKSNSCRGCEVPQLNFLQNRKLKKQKNIKQNL